MSFDDPNQQDIDALLDTAHDKIRDLLEHKDGLIGAFDRMRHGDLALSEIHDLLDELVTDLARLGELGEFMYAALLLTAYYHTGRQDLRKTALQLFSPEELEAVVADEPDSL